LKIIYIKESEENNWKLKFKRLFNKIEECNIEDKKIYILPVCKETKFTKYLTRKISNGLLKKIYNENIENIVLSEVLNTNKLLKNKLYDNNINILNGRFLYKALSYNVLEYIYKYKKDKFNEVTILINDLNNIDIQNIILISTKVKRVNIVTNHIEKFKEIDNYLYNKLGILINISNNKQKSLSKSTIIINYDFPEELINSYVINTNAIIINTYEEIKIRCMRFNGIIINDFILNIPLKHQIKGFKNEIIYESLIYKKDLNEIIKCIVRDDIYVKKIIGTNGIISENELVK